MEPGFQKKGGVGVGIDENSNWSEQVCPNIAGW